MIVTKEQLVIKRSEWDCYVDTPDTVIDEVNQIVHEILSTTHSPVWAQKRIYDALYDNDKYRDFGFSDSECCQCATDVINKYYNSNIDRWEHLKLREGK